MAPPGSDLAPRLWIVASLERCNALGEAFRGRGFEVRAIGEESLADALEAGGDGVDVCVLELQGPNPLAVVEEVAARLPTTRIMVLNSDPSGTGLIAALRAGATGYLSSDLDADRVAVAVAETLAGRSAVSRSLVGPLLAELRSLDLD
jgi:DNA-binding NarL/FixJ family response regulator